MLYALAMILLVLWLLGLVTGTTIGGFVQLLLVIALVLVVINPCTGRKRVI